MSHEIIKNLTADEALEKLKSGNQIYMNSRTGSGDISPEKRLDTCRNGQQPYAIIITCSDSRVLPESVFSAGIGELFVIRVAGNVMDDHQLGSVEYAASHLGVKLIVVMGHNHCGAVAPCHRRRDRRGRSVPSERPSQHRGYRKQSCHSRGRGARLESDRSALSP